jgi:hypothetical protein
MKIKAIYLFAAKAAFVTILGACIFFTPSSSFAANICVGPTATGNGSGSDWNNRAVFPFSTGNWNGFWVRGNTYYVADGTYTTSEGAPYPCVIRCSAPNSGTQKIIIKKATAAACSGIAGWNTATMGSGTAIFQGTAPAAGGILFVFYFTSSYWDIDGVTGTGNNASSYGFRTRALGSALGNTYHVTTPDDLNASTVVSHINLKHIDFEGRGVDLGSATEREVLDTAVRFVNTASNVYSTDINIQNCYFHDSDNVFSMYVGVKGSVFDRCYFTRNESNSNSHGEGIQTNARGSEVVAEDVVVKYCTFEDVEGTAMISLGNGYKWYVYGNIFLLTSGYPNATANQGQCGDQGCSAYMSICSNVATRASDIYVFNNTFYNINPRKRTGSSLDAIGAAGVYDYYSSGSIRYYTFNNLFADCYIQYPQPTPSYNAFYHMVYGGITTDGTNAQTVSSNPFLNTSAGNANFLRLSIATNAGVNPTTIIPASLLNSTFGLANLTDINADSDNKIRGADGTWDRGAFEFATNQPPPDNKSLKVVY